MGGVAGAPVGASPVPGGNIGFALAGGGTSLVANEGKAGGWEPSRKFTFYVLKREKSPNM